MNNYGIQLNHIYQHYKGNLYIPIAIATNSETLTPMVVYYNAIDTAEIWVRPIDGDDNYGERGWNDLVIIDNEAVPRFRHLELDYQNIDKQ